ncbi:hypothetical protein KBD71_03110 [Candidatus Woesebacteria bacterium]|nr:hypothetical protein [Candidatus Woesebacteria bacterium]
MTEQHQNTPSDKQPNSMWKSLLQGIFSGLARRETESKFMDEQVAISDKVEQHFKMLEAKAKQAVGTYSVVSVRYNQSMERYRIRAIIPVDGELVELPYEVLKRNITWIEKGSAAQSLTISNHHSFSAELWDGKYPDGERIVFFTPPRN